MSKSCEIHVAEWDIFYPADLDESRVPQILRPLTNVEHEMNDFPWYTVGRLVELLEKPESSFAYLHVTVYFRARAAMLALNGDILDHTELFGALSKHQLQVGGIYRKHLQNYLLMCMQKHNMARLPECDRHRMDPFDDPGETEKNRDLMRRCIQAAERAFINTLNFISEGPGMDARIEGESVEFWVKRIERDRAMDVRVRVTRNAGGYRVKPCRDEAIATFGAGGTARAFVVRLQEEFPFGKAETEGAKECRTDTHSGRRREKEKVAKSDDTTATVAQKAAEIALATIAPALRCSKLNPNRGATDDLVQAYNLERKKHANDVETFWALSRLDIETARKTPDKAPWMRLSDANRHYRQAVHGDAMRAVDIATRADALQRRYRRAIEQTQRLGANK
ncbi:MAG: hypothetical protein WCI03_12155 [bacterium]